RFAVIDKWITCRDAVVFIRAVRAERIDPQNLAKCDAEVLRVTIRIAFATTVREAHIEKTEIGAGGCRERIERQMAPVVVRVRFLNSDHFTWGATIVGSCCWSLRCPLEHDDVVCAQCRSRLEIAWHAHVGGVGVGIEFAESARARLAELGMKCEALQTAFASLGL